MVPAHTTPACACCYYKRSTNASEPGWVPGTRTKWVWNDVNAPHKHLLDNDAWNAAQAAFEDEEYGEMCRATATIIEACRIAPLRQ